MFVLRGVAVSLAVFFLVYCLLSLLVAIGWSWVSRLRGLTARSLANLLFTLRVLPMAGAAAITLALAVPSFWLLEPRSIDEDTGFLPMLLGCCCLVLFGVGLFRVIAAQTRTSRVITKWLRGAKSVDIGVAAPTFRTHAGIPPMTLAGVCKPRLLVSDSTVTLLSGDELRIALQHELAHLGSLDNLKKLTLRSCVAPGMSELENAWLEAAEMAADEKAVSSVSDALDLAAALIKLSRLVTIEPAPAITMGLTHAGHSISARVARLLAWEETRHQSTRMARYVLPPLVATLCAVALNYGPVLAQTHRLTEWLVQ